MVKLLNISLNIKLLKNIKINGTLNMVVDLEQTATIVYDNADYYTSAPDFESSKDFKFEYIHFFQGREHKFNLMYPLPCFFYCDDDSLIGECPNLGLISAGESEKEIRKNFDADIDFLYANYVLESNAKLTKDGKELKLALKNIISTVE